MIGSITKLFTKKSDKSLQKFNSVIEKINEFEAHYSALNDSELIETTIKFQKQLHEGRTIEDILPSAFAAVRESAFRHIGLRHYDVQLLGGLVLHYGNIAEMKTGEGKTLVATLAAYLNAISGKGVHIVTVNDYLARRDVQWMGPVYSGLGLSVSALQHETSFIYDQNSNDSSKGLMSLKSASRKEAYAADITYGTNHEFGFDYLRDNMSVDEEMLVQRGLNYSIVDEVDYILIDEARTPLIISGPAQEANRLYGTMAKITPRLQENNDFMIEEKNRGITLTDEGISKVEKILNLGNLYDPENFQLIHYVENAIRASVIYKKDRDYVVQSGNIVIVDEFTGRLMEGRRFSDGLHQAIEAKEGVRIRQESITYATITLQNYFRMYEKLAGMTGTASTESEEFMKIYGLGVIPVPSNRPMVRDDHSDVVYKTSNSKWKAIVEDIEEKHKSGRPILIGTTSIENSESLSMSLKKRGIPHEVLNAKNHEREASIVANAGRMGSVTVATNMAGRGTDIILGGNLESSISSELYKRGIQKETDAVQVSEIRDDFSKEWEKEQELVRSSGGLYVLGTEKHEARRIDNQLRGRSGRQGDPGESRFYVSLEDDVMRRFGGERVKGFMDLIGIEEDQPIEANMVTKAIGNVQTKVEAHNFEIRKHLVEFDDVINMQREVIYGERVKILAGADLKLNIADMVEKELVQIVDDYFYSNQTDGQNPQNLVQEISSIVGEGISDLDFDELFNLDTPEIKETIMNHVFLIYDQNEEQLKYDAMRELERVVMLRTIDSHWVNHLTAMENLRQGVGLQAFGQRDPLVAYRAQGHEQFQEMLLSIQHDIVSGIFHLSSAEYRSEFSKNASPSRNKHIHTKQSRPIASAPANNFTKGSSEKIGRNDQCPCGSGKKYKRCHGVAV
tara:strand:+ start:6347 stop:9061 length:2715 start_codon:yes stop_codon:yes gene_type:complete